MKLLCFTYAGGNKYSYRDLEPCINTDIEFVTLELPGRGRRMNEPLITNLNELVEDLYQQIQEYIHSDYMIYGHSMGGMLGNLLIHKLKENLQKMPFHFLITGCASPICRSKKRQLHMLNELDFQKEIKSLGGIPKWVIENSELLDYIMPILRSDITAIETHVYTARDKYNVPITTIRGTEEGLSDEDMLSWQEETSSKLTHISLPGGHFFILDHMLQIGNLINKMCYKKQQIEAPAFNG